ncbi:MAG: MmcQ/YjbR family DNA-binding protein [Pseudomonadales bacterium]|nr:MmcQ/YjbR family DNA-binding protein [Pseudomonadales bacterium]
MDVEQTKAFCLSFPGAEESLSGPPANILSYKVGGKKFAYFKTSKPEQWRFSFRVTPSRFLELTDQPGIKPARYMHRFHWVTVVKVPSVPEDYLKELIQWSWEKAFSSLPKKVQRELRGE